MRPTLIEASAIVEQAPAVVTCVDKGFLADALGASAVDSSVAIIWSLVKNAFPKIWVFSKVKLAAGLRSGDGWLADFSALVRLTAGSIG
jgi:hypothetical protein